MEQRDGEIYLAASGRRPAVRLVPITSQHKLQWDRNSPAPDPPRAHELDGDTRIAATAESNRRTTVAGPLREVAACFELSVRQVRV